MLLAVTALQTVAWALVTPALQGPDESAHIAAVERLVEHGDLEPKADTSGLPRELLLLADIERTGPLVGNRDARPAWDAFDERQYDAAVAALGDHARDFIEPKTGPPTRGDSRNPPLYTLYEAVPYALAHGAPLVDRVTVMRLAGIPLAMITVAACWLLAAELIPGSGLAPLVAGGVAALQPERAFLDGVVNPDGLLVALVSLLMLASVRLVRRGPSARRIGVLAGLSVVIMLTHARGTIFVPVAGLAVLLSVPWGSMHGRRRALLIGACVGAIAALIGAYVLMADVLGVSATGASTYPSKSFSARQFVSYVWEFYLPRLPFMDPPLGGDYGFRQVYVETFWGTFGSLEVRFPTWAYDLLEGATLLLLAGLAASLLSWRRSVVRHWREAVVLGAFVVAPIVSLHVIAYRLLRVDPTDPIIVGRHLLVLIAPLSAAVALVVTRLPPRAAAYVAAVVLASLAVMDLAGLGSSFMRFFA
jgi:hypothetical protein